MRLKFRALGDPAFEYFLLLRGENLVRIRRRHEIIALIEDTSDDVALVRLSGSDDGDAVLGLHRGVLKTIEPQFRLAGRRIRAVTDETILRQDRAHVAVVFNRRRFAGRHQLNRAVRNNPTDNKFQ